jgi:hypothetical protein
VLDSLTGAELEEAGLRRSFPTAERERSNRRRLEKAPPSQTGSRIAPHVHVSWESYRNNAGDFGQK